MIKCGKFVLILLALCIAVTSVSAMDYTEYADELFDLGLFLGTGNGYALSKTLTREQAVTLIVRLLGAEKEALEAEYTKVFSDVREERWSYPYIMYCYENKITLGTGNSSFSPEYPIPAEQFTALVLRVLGYTEAAPEKAMELAVEYQLFNSDRARNLSEAVAFLRGEAVYIMRRSLSCYMTDGFILAEFLAKKGVITSEEAIKYDLYNTDDINDLIDDILG